MLPPYCHCCYIYSPLQPMQGPRATHGIVLLNKICDLNKDEVGIDDNSDMRNR